MAARVTFEDSDEAESIVQTLRVAGYDAGSAKERIARDDGEVEAYVVHTDAPPQEIDDLVDDPDAVVEAVDPTTGAVAPVRPQPND